MKTLTLTITSVLLSALLMLTSCTKQNEIITPASNADNLTEQFKLEAEQMSEEFTTNGQDNRLWWYLAILGAKDALGGALAYYSGADGELIVATAAVTSICAASPTQTPDDFDWYNNINRGQYVENTASNPNNSFDFIGLGHNEFVINSTIQSVENQLSLYDGAAATFNGCSSKMISEKALMNMVSGVVNAKTNSALLNEIAKSNLTKTNKWVLNFYFTKCFQAKNIAALQQFSVNFENMIAANKKLSSNTKNGLLMTMAINRYSVGMWSEIL